MNNQAAVCFLIVLAAGLVFLVLYQQYAFRRGIQSQLKQVNKKLEEIARTGSDEKVMVFTGNPVMMELCRQINRMLNERQKIKADVKKGEISSRKMLANISHDIKTPLTVILGYLEIMELKKQALEIWYDDQTSDACIPSDFLYQFHRFVLENGPADFRTLSARLYDIS